MVWTDITRPRYERKLARHASDCRDAEWALIEPPLHRSTGRPRKTDLREVWNAIQYMADAAERFPARLYRAELFLRLEP